MTIAAKLITLFPAFHLCLTLSQVYYFINRGNFFFLFSSLFCLYFLPILLKNIHQLFFKIKIGESDIFAKSYCPWWTNHQLQMLYMSFPFIETSIRLIPGAYTVWLRLWGSRIGKNVYWTPGVTIYDRDLIEISDNCIIGEKALFVAHIISPRNGRGILTIEPIKVEKNAFIGAGTVLSHGCLIKEGALLKAGTELYPRSIFSKSGLEAGRIKGQ